MVLGELSTPCAAIGAELPMTLYMAQKLYTKIHKRLVFQTIILFVDVVVQCGNTVIALKDMVITKGLNYARMYPH